MRKGSLLIALFALITMVVVSCGGETKAPESVQLVVEEVVAVEETVEPTVDFGNGKEIYDQLCFNCHANGIAGAAKLDDKARWGETAARGLVSIHERVIAGYTGDYGVMPPKGGNPNFSDEDVKNAVAYMLSAAGVVAE